MKISKSVTFTTDQLKMAIKFYLEKQENIKFQNLKHGDFNIEFINGTQKENLLFTSMLFKWEDT